jgi:HlyD family secretion protein
VKTGLPGMGYVRYDENAQWPEFLQLKTANPQSLWTPTGSKSTN